jgi:hypothetical protein
VIYFWPVKNHIKYKVIQSNRIFVNFEAAELSSSLPTKKYSTVSGNSFHITL